MPFKNMDTTHGSSDSMFITKPKRSENCIYTLFNFFMPRLLENSWSHGFGSPLLSRSAHRSEDLM